MPRELGQLRVVPEPQGEHVAVAGEDDGFPPPVFQGFLGDDEMARRDLLPFTSRGFPLPRLLLNFYALGS
jgi:hypothetical protein